MPSVRLQRVRELLKREIGEAIRREIPVGEAGLEDDGLQLGVG